MNDPYVQIAMNVRAMQASWGDQSFCAKGIKWLARVGGFPGFTRRWVEPEACDAGDRGRDRESRRYAACGCWYIVNV